MTHIGILQCDKVQSRYKSDRPSYQQMFATLLHAKDESLRFTTYVCFDDHFPSDITCCDAWLITGSKSACYENLPWMLKLEDLIREFYINGVPCIGVCFGHQIMALALGGKVEKSPKGWGVGTATIKLCDNLPWMQPFKDQLNIPVSHQDQIVKLPDEANIIGGSDFCPYFLLNYGTSLMSIQGHPEFSKSYAEALIHERKKDIGQKRSKQALESLNKSADSMLFAQWMLSFITQDRNS